MNKRIVIILAAAITMLTGPQLSKAQQPLADPSDMPYITLLDEFTLYASSDIESSGTIGAIEAFRSVKLAPMEMDRLMYIPSMDKVKVVTDAGEAWIDLNKGAYKYGQLERREQKITLLEPETALYDSASPYRMSDFALSPQQVQAIASIDVCDPYTACFGKDKWYLIRTTFLGDKWIRPYHYAEKYVGEPVEGMIPISREMEVYKLPFEKPETGEPKLKPQIVKPVAKYTHLVRMVPPIIWYQIETPQGLRWIKQDSIYGLGVEGVEQVDRSLDIPVPFHYYDSLYGPPSGEQQAQTVHAIGKKDDWYFVLTEGSGKWVNPAKAMASRMTGEFENDAKLGVKLSDARLELSESSIANSTPYLDFSHMEGTLTFTPQTITASRVWKSPNGETWYYIHTWQGAIWVRP